MKKIGACFVGLCCVLLCFESSAQQLPAKTSLEKKRQQFAAASQAFDKKEFAKALPLWQALHTSYPELHDYVSYFLAQTLTALEQPEGALRYFQRFLVEYPGHVLEGNARFEVANLLLEANMPHEALALSQNVSSDQHGVPQEALLYQQGQAYAQTAQYKEAAALFHRLVSLYPQYPLRDAASKALQELVKTHPDVAPVWTEELLWEHARALARTGSYTAAIKQYTAFQRRYPQSSRAADAWFEIAGAYRASGKATQRMDVLEQVAAQYAASHPEVAARAVYSIGIIHWNRDKNEQAAQDMQRIVKDFSETEWGDDAYYVLGRIAQGKAAHAEASAWYLALAQKYQSSSFAEEALWRAGWAAYSAEKYERAEQIFSQGAGRFLSSSYSDDNVYWKGRSLESQDKRGAAVRAYQNLIAISPGTYYAVLAHQRLQALDIPGNTARPPRPAEYPSLASLLARLRSSLPAPYYKELFSHTAKALELHAVDLQFYARKEVAWLEHFLDEEGSSETIVQHRGLLTYFVSRVYAELQEYLLAIQWASRLESSSEQAWLRHEAYTLDPLKYPLAYWELIRKYATQNNLNPFLVAGIIRQESAYNPKARSYANARGLMQVIPETGKRVARQLGMKTFKTADLYDPETNIAIGTKYVATLLERFDGNLFRAIAGYNAGPNKTEKWWKEQSPSETDQEKIVETITYRATRNYVKHVFRNQYQYQTIYQHLLENPPPLARGLQPEK